jgi:hypothetical protein
MLKNIPARNAFLLILVISLVVAVPVSAFIVKPAGNTTNGTTTNQTGTGNASSAHPFAAATVPSVTPADLTAVLTTAPATPNTPLSPVMIVTGVGIAAFAVVMRSRR